MWVARDKTGSLYLYKDKPLRDLGMFVADRSLFMKVNKEEFSDLKWEDEPIEVELVRNKNMNGFIFLGYTNECKLIGSSAISVRGLSNDEKANNYRVELGNGVLIIKKWESSLKNWIVEMALSNFTLVNVNNSENDRQTT